MTLLEAESIDWAPTFRDLRHKLKTHRLESLFRGRQFDRRVSDLASWRDNPIPNGNASMTRGTGAAPPITTEARDESQENYPELGARPANGINDQYDPSVLKFEIIRVASALTLPIMVIWTCLRSFI